MKRRRAAVVPSLILLQVRLALAFAALRQLEAAQRLEEAFTIEVRVIVQ